MKVRLRWICGVTLRDKVHIVEIKRRQGIVLEVLGRGRGRWFGHVEPNASDNWVSGVMLAGHRT